MEFYGLQNIRFVFILLTLNVFPSSEIFHLSSTTECVPSSRTQKSTSPRPLTGPAETEEVTTHPNQLLKDVPHNLTEPAETEEVTTHPNQLLKDVPHNLTGPAETEEVTTHPNKLLKDVPYNLTGSAEAEEVTTHPNQLLKDVPHNLTGPAETEEVTTHPNQLLRDVPHNLLGPAVTEEVTTHPNQLLKDVPHNLTGPAETEEVTTYPNQLLKDVPHNLTGPSETEEVTTHPNQLLKDVPHNLTGPSETEEVTTQPNYTDIGRVNSSSLNTSHLTQNQTSDKPPSGDRYQSRFRTRSDDKTQFIFRNRSEDKTQFIVRNRSEDKTQFIVRNRSEDKTQFIFRSHSEEKTQFIVRNRSEGRTEPGERTVSDDFTQLANDLDESLSSRSTMNRVNSSEAFSEEISYIETEKRPNIWVNSTEFINSSRERTLNQQDLEISTASGVEVSSLSISATKFFAKLDALFVFRCKGRCGTKESFPCSCHAICLVYGTCCEGFTQDCPDTMEESLVRFAFLRRTDIVCSDYNIYVVMSCPSPRDKNDMQGVNGFDDVENPSRKTLKETENVDVKSSPDKDIQAKEEMTTGISDSVNISTGSFIDKLRDIFLSVPVTDPDTGLTFINKRIYDCHKMSSALPFHWSLALEFTGISPTRIEDFEDTKSFELFRPAFDVSLLYPHQCRAELIGDCNQTVLTQLNFPERLVETISDKCNTHLTAVRQYSRNGGMHFYRNKYCIICNVGPSEYDNNRYELVSPFLNPFKSHGLHVLMSLTMSGHFNLKVITPSWLSTVDLSWNQAQCDNLNLKQSEISRSEGSSTCAVKCSSHYTMSSDGHCKMSHTGFVAVSDDGLLPLCRIARDGLAKFISCGLQDRLENLKFADFHPPTVSTYFDPRLGKRLYVVKILFDLPSPVDLVFSQTMDESIINIYHMAVLVKSFHKHRLLQDVCSRHNRERIVDSDSQIIHTKNLSGAFNRGYNSQVVFQQKMVNMRGPTVDMKNVTTLCFSHSFLSGLSEPLMCIEDFLYESDRAAMEEYQSSPCFNHLQKQAPTSTGAAVAIEMFAWASSLMILSL